MLHPRPVEDTRGTGHHGEEERSAFGPGPYDGEKGSSLGGESIRGGIRTRQIRMHVVVKLHVAPFFDQIENGRNNRQMQQEGP